MGGDIPFRFNSNTVGVVPFGCTPPPPMMCELSIGLEE